MKAKDWYNIIFNSYDSLYKEEQTQKINFIISNLKNFIKNKLDRGLDYGCGTGLSIKIIKEFCRELYGYDVSENMLKLAKKRYPNVIFLQSLEYSEFFDLITCITVLQDSDNPKKDIETLYRILKPEGFVIISVLKRGRNKDFWKELISSKFKIFWEGEEYKDYVFFAKKP